MGTADTVTFLSLLHRYYAHELTKIDPDSWSVFDLLAAEPLAHDDACVRDAVLRIAQAPVSDIERFEYEFNRLFVGPGELPAAPYETVYVSGDRVLMRQTSMAVRRAYADVGLMVNAKNVEPDDHLAFECAFLAQLAGRRDAASRAAFASFAREHWMRWAPAHVAAVRASTSNEVCLGFADLLEAVSSVIQLQVSK